MQSGRNSLDKPNDRQVQCENTRIEKLGEIRTEKGNTKQEALKAAPDSVSAQGEEEAFRSLSNGIFVNF